MPAAFKTALGNAAATASGTTCVITTTAAIAVDDLVVVRWAADNLNASTPTGAVTDSGGNTYTVRAFRGNNATAAAGVVGGIAATKATAPVASGGTITLTLSGSVVQKAMFAESFTGVDNALRNAVVVASGASTAPSVTSGSATSGDLVISAVAIESRTAPSAYDSDTSNGSWSTGVVNPSATTGTDATLVEVVGQYKIVTATATQIYNLTIASTDWAAMVCIFIATPPPLTVPARTFDGVDDRIEFSPSSLVGMTYGTIAALFRWDGTQAAFVSNVPFSLETSTNTHAFGMRAYKTGGGNGWLSLFADGSYSDIAWANPDTTSWRLVVLQKGTGTVAGRAWVYDYATGTWPTDNAAMSGTAANAARVIDKEIIGWDTADNTYLKGDVAAVAAWKNIVLTTTQVKTLINGYAAWFATDPTQVKVLNQASIATAIPDQLDAGSTQTTIVGTAVSTNFSPFPDSPVAPPAYVSSGVVYVDGVSTSPTLTLTHAAGDLLLAVAQQYPGTSTTPTPTGWTLVDGPLDTSNPTRSWCWKRIADGTATDNLTLTFSQSSSGGVVGVAIRNQDATTPIDVVATPVADHAQSSTSTRALTSLSAGSLDVHIGILSNNSSWYPHTPTGGEVERLNSAAQWAGVMVSTEQHPTSGSVRAAIPYTHDTSVDAHLRSFVIRSAAAPPTPPAGLSYTTKYSNVANAGTGGASHDTTVDCGTVTTGKLLTILVGTTGNQGGNPFTTPSQASGTATLGAITSIGVANSSNGDKAAAQAWQCVVTAGGTLVLNIQDSLLTFGFGVTVLEWTGQATTTPVAGPVTAQSDSAGDLSPPTATLSATPVADDRTIAFVNWDTDMGVKTVSAGSGFTAVGSVVGTGSDYVQMLTQQRTASTSTTVTWPTQSGPTTYSKAGVAFVVKALPTAVTPSVVAATNTGVGPSTTGVTKPAGGQAGDYYVIYYSSETVRTVTFTGFTAAPGGMVGATGQNGQYFWKAYDGSEGSTFSNVGGNGGEWTGYLCFLVRGLPAGWTPYIPAPVTVIGSTAVVLPAVNSLPANTLMLVSYKDYNGTGWSVPGTFVPATTTASPQGYSQKFDSGGTAGPFTITPSPPSNSFNMAQQLFSAAPPGGGPVALAGSSAGVATTTAALARAVPLTGLSIGGSSDTAALSRDVPLAALATGVGTATATTLTTVAGGGPVALAGSSDGVATTTGTLGRGVPVAGSSAGVSTTTGTLARGVPVAGAAAGTSTTTGTLVATVGLAGSSAGTSTDTASLARAVPLAGSSAGTSTVTGSFVGTTALAGSSAGVSTTAATTLIAARSLVGSSAGVGTASGDLSRTSASGVFGNSAGTGAASGSLSVFHPLAGSSAGSSTASATLGRGVALAGSSAGVSTTIGALARAVPLDGSSAGSSTVSTAPLRVAIALTGSSDGLSTVVASLAVAHTLVALATGTSTASGDLFVGKGQFLTGTSVGTGTAQGTLQVIFIAPVYGIWNGLVFDAMQYGDKQVTAFQMDPT